MKYIRKFWVWLKETMHRFLNIEAKDLAVITNQNEHQENLKSLLF
jgi:hypothetical protein